MKIFVFGVDGLEAKLVEGWELKDFMQKYWGIHDVLTVLGKEEKLYTPIIWGAFLLGKPPSLYGFNFSNIREQRLKIAYGSLYPLYCFKRRLFPGKSFGLRKIMQKIGLFSTERLKVGMPKVEHLPEEAISDTIIGKVKQLGYRVWVKEFPAYNDEKIAKFRVYMRQYFDADLKLRLKYLNEIYEIAYDIYEEALSKADEYDLILYYNPVIDYANHMLFRPRNYKLMVHLASYYRKVGKMVKNVREELKNTAILVVSDHGYDPKIHDHSNYGFWSSNVQLPEKPLTILHFHRIILHLLDS